MQGSKLFQKLHFFIIRFFFFKQPLLLHTAVLIYLITKIFLIYRIIWWNYNRTVSTKRWNNVNSTFIQRQDVEWTLNRHCLNVVFPLHYENTPNSNIIKILPPNNKNFSDKNSDIFHISAQNIDCGYSLEPPQRGGSNEYPQSMFLSRNKKNNVYPGKPQFYYIYKSGV